MLQVPEAGVSHIVDEFCSLSLGDTDCVMQQCEDLLCLLAEFLTRGSQLSYMNTQQIRAARVFPVLVTDPASQRRPELVLRSITDGNWYVPDMAILESAFRGKADLLGIPVRSILDSRCVFEQLECQNMFLSRCVEETVALRGASIRDKPREEEMRRRVACISW